MLKDKRDYENEDDVDLTGIIHEYSQDNELRRKIDALKKQKEEEKKASQPMSVLDQLAGMSENDTYQDVESSVKNGQGIPDIRVDDTMVDKTRVGFEDDRDKTLVIMGQKQGVSYDSAFDTQPINENKTAMFHMNEAGNFDYDDEESEEEFDEDTEEEEEDDDNNLLSRIKERRREKELAKNEDDDDDEDEEDLNHDNSKMNKIITYVIIGIVGICIIVGAFFGVKYVLGNFLGGSDSDKQTETTKPKDTDKDKDKDTNKGSDEGNSAKPKEDINDDSAKVAQLNKQLDTYEKQLEDIKKDIDSAKSDYDSADKELQGYNDLLTQASTYQAQAKALEDAVNKAQAALDAAQDDAAKTAAQEVLDKAKEQYDSSYNDLVTKSNDKNNEYNSKSSAIKAANDKKNTANSKLKDLNNKKSGIEENIAKVTTELGKYE